MHLLVLIVASVASAIAVLFTYFALPSWRRTRPTFALFPTRATAVLACLVALKGWFELLMHT